MTYRQAVQQLLIVLSTLAQQKLAKGKKIMFVFRRFIVRKNERGLLFKQGDFVKFLEPGTYHYFDPLRRMSIEVYDLSVPFFQHRLVDFFLKHYPEEVARYFTIVELGAHQTAWVYENNRLTDILYPSTRTVFWKGMVEVRTELFDISENFELTSQQAAPLIYTKSAPLLQKVRECIYSKEVSQHQIGVLYVNGRCLKTLPPGLHAFWHFNRTIHLEVWDTRVQEMEVSGQEILSKDKVNLRINLSVSYVIKDVLQTITILSQPVAYLYKELQFGLRAAVGTRTLDELLENREVMDGNVLTYIRGKMTDVGIEIRSVGVKDIILPGEMKTILSKVVEAEKSAQANLIKRREETAATRSLLNTAKVMEDNPIALRLKELETLEKVTDKIGNISVYGGLDGLLKELVKIR